jgi:hypothetical protein
MSNNTTESTKHDFGGHKMKTLRVYEIEEQYTGSDGSTHESRDYYRSKEDAIRHFNETALNPIVDINAIETSSTNGNTFESDGVTFTSEWQNVHTILIF